MKKSFFNKPLISFQIVLLLLLVVITVVLGQRLFSSQINLLIKIEPNQRAEVASVAGGVQCVDFWCINTPTWYQRLLFSDERHESPLQLLFLLFILWQVWAITRRLNPKNLFEQNVSRPLWLIAAAIMILWLVDYIIFMWMKDVITTETAGAYRLHRAMRLPLMVPLAGLLFLWLSDLFKKGHQLQQEQNLTI